MIRATSLSFTYLTQSLTLSFGKCSYHLVLSRVWRFIPFSLFHLFYFSLVGSAKQVVHFKKQKLFVDVFFQSQKQSKLSFLLVSNVFWKILHSKIWFCLNRNFLRSHSCERRSLFVICWGNNKNKNHRHSDIDNNILI